MFYRIKADDALIEKALKTTPGITGFARAHRAEKSVEAIISKAKKIMLARSMSTENHDCISTPKKFTFTA